MSYVTQGTVQIELKTGTGANDTNDITVTINPAQDYTVRHDSKTFIVFIEDEPKDQPAEAGAGKPKVQPRRTMAFEKTQIFTIRTENSKKAESPLVQSLVDAALKRTKIEVKIVESVKKKTREAAKKNLKKTQDADTNTEVQSPRYVIESIKIPATP